MGNKVMVARRDMREEKTENLVKVAMELADGNAFVDKMEALLVDIHRNLYDRAVAVRDANIVLAPHRNEDEDEDLIQVETRKYFENQPDVSGVGQTGKAKALCIPCEQPSDLSKEEVKCFHSGKRAKKWILFGRSY